MPDSLNSREKVRLAPVVLIVDDERQAHLMLPRILVNAGVVENIVHAFDGVEAIHYLDQQTSGGPGVPFLILLDLEMPRKDGLEVLRWMRERGLTSRALTVVITGTQSAQVREEALRLGAYAIMEKFPAATDLLGCYVSARARLPKPGPTTWVRQPTALVPA